LILGYDTGKSKIANFYPLGPLFRIFAVKSILRGLVTSETCHPGLGVSLSCLGRTGGRHENHQKSFLES
jgi:hypothetical protein